MNCSMTGQKLADQFKVLFFELSAKQSDVSFIDEVFHQLVINLPKDNSMDLQSSATESDERYHISIPDRRSSSCCGSW